MASRPSESMQSAGWCRLRKSDFQVERVAPVTVDGDFATTFMKYTSVSAGGTEVGVFQLEEGKILRYWFFKLGATPPFDDAVMP